MVEPKHYISTATAYCAMMKLLFNGGFIRVHTAAYPSVSGFGHKNAVALLEPYEGRFGTGYRLIIRMRGRRNDRVTYFVKVQSIGQKGK